MTREEAIKWMEETIQDAEGLLDKCSPALKEEVLEQNEVFKIAISVLRSAPQPGKPLTLDQLREMQCEKVVLYRMKSTEPLETGTVKENGDVLGDAGTLAYHELYLETWVAFSVAPAQQRWIPVSERLPERRRRVLCWLSYPDIEEIIVENQYYGNGMWMVESEAVTHWMPLPEPPEEG